MLLLAVSLVFASIFQNNWWAALHISSVGHCPLTSYSRRWRFSSLRHIAFTVVLSQFLAKWIFVRMLEYVNIAHMEQCTLRNTYFLGFGGFSPGVSDRLCFVCLWLCPPASPMEPPSLLRAGCAQLWSWPLSSSVLRDSCEGASTSWVQVPRFLVCALVLRLCSPHPIPGHFQTECFLPLSC